MPPTAGADQVVRRLGDLPDRPTPAAEVPRSPGSRCSTRWSSPRCASPSETTSAPARSRPRCSRTDHVDVRFALARPGHRADLGQQLKHDRRRRTSFARRPAPRRRDRGRLTGGMTHELVTPVKAVPGDRVAVLSPSFAAPAVGPAVHEQAMARLREVTGLVPVEYPTTRRLNATAADRASGPQRSVRRPGDPRRPRHHRGRRPDHRDPAPRPRAGPARPQAVPWLQRQHQPAELAVVPRGRVVPRRLDPGPARPRSGPGRDPPGVAARRPAGRRAAGDHRAGRVGGHRAAVGRPGRAHVVRRARADRALDLGRPAPGRSPGRTWGGCIDVLPWILTAGRFPDDPACARRRRPAPRGLGGPDPGHRSSATSCARWASAGCVAAADAVVVSRPPTSTTSSGPAPRSAPPAAPSSGTSRSRRCSATTRTRWWSSASRSVTPGRTGSCPTAGRMTVDGAERRVWADYD